MHGAFAVGQHRVRRLLVLRHDEYDNAVEAVSLAQLFHRDGVR